MRFNSEQGGEGVQLLQQFGETYSEGDIKYPIPDKTGTSRGCTRGEAQIILSKNTGSLDSPTALARLSHRLKL